ncbi:MAG: hypothetical protein IJP18_09780 [Oscillospiraceae bacterium]|nr:hypothetical protein [Oscillospiraceae bacterium]
MIKTFFKGVGYTFLSCVLSLMFVFFSVIFLKSTVMTVIAGLCTLFILCGLHINYAYFEAKRQRVSDKTQKKNFSLKVPFIMSMGAVLPLVAMWSVLMISRTGLIMDVLGIYKLANEHFLLITAFMCDGIKATEISTSDCLLLFAVNFIPFFPVFITYFITYHEIDIRKKIFYEK